MATDASVITPVFDLSEVNNEPRVCIKGVIGSVNMAGSDKHLLYFQQDRISVLNENGEKQVTIDFCSNIKDVCWSSYLNQFIILCYDTVCLLDIVGKSRLTGYELSRGMSSCTCFEEVLLLKPKIGSFMEEYNISSWELIRTHKPPVSCNKNQDIHAIRFNSTGTHLGLLISSKTSNNNYVFALHNWKDNMKLVQIITDLHLSFASGNPNLLSLPDRQFLVYSNHDSHEIHSINDSTG
ncbi:unnamed protein product [Rotaria sp. Silwood2]|nr:unnamed protein product [Rotaria sp. Silwood2]CAF3155857.1 unnamed protein product [Rotaria sp. Silwood2]CAF3369804.1 unnamed protein product [Rotaria sp. Silwood2]CAF3467919.1 unnamed protein product [Rotaria sp. Silwood2]CAF4491861.1 unnamed protein product [Rotaria sp. Silwood2]